MNPSSRRTLHGLRPLALLIVFFALPTLLFAQTQAPAKSLFDDAPAADREVIAKAEDLVSQGKWLSAWNSLAEANPDNSNPFILAEKIRLALDGYAQTSMHVVFGFVDLPEGQDIATARSEMSDLVEPIDFSPSELAKAIEAKGEALPPVLSLMLGNYYYTVWKEYEGQWLEDDATLLTSGAEQYERASAYDVFTIESLDHQSAMLYAMERYDGAEAVVKKALELEPENNAFTLRLANIYYSSGRFADVFAEADKVIAKPNDDAELNNAYVIAIEAGLKLVDKDVLEKYVSGFEKSFPTEYMPGLVRHLVAVQLGDEAAANAAADAVTAAFPGNPDVIRSILSTWLSSQNADSGFKYLDRTIAMGPADDAMAALYFYRALLDMEAAQTVESTNQALADLATAEGYFKKSYPEGHQVFGMINDLKKQLSDALNSGQAQQGDAQKQEEATAPQSDAASNVPAQNAEPEQAAPADATSGATE